MRNKKQTFKMLTGRESLIRLIGKKRRHLVDENSLLNSPTPANTCLNLSTANDNVNDRLLLSSSENAKRGQIEERGEQEHSIAEPEGGGEAQQHDYVTCPVCETSIRGGDGGFTINSHLDSCLSASSSSRGTKRKLTQLTLFQLMNFPSSSTLSLKVQHCSNDETEEKNGTVTRDLDLELNESASSSGSDSESESGVDNVDTRAIDVSTENYTTVVNQTNPGSKVEDIDGMLLETYIVGRRFSEEKEVNVGASIYLLRDPDNVKDPCAIKVVSEASESSKMLGFLPKGLAQYLSPLIERFCLKFEGLVTSVPKHSLDVVPIQIVCQKATPSGENASENIEDFQFLWKNMLHVIESMKSNAPCTTKYQENFCLLVTEVLRNNNHVFTKDERRFLDSFTSLSEDSQRLFIRLYSRKGLCPWFRMSNISYPEVSNCQQAVKELTGKGYICSFQEPNEMHYDSLEEILNLLTVSELHEISYLLKKSRNRSLRKQDLVSSLLSAWGPESCNLLSSAILKRAGVCIRISSTAQYLIWRVERLFFLNGEQDLSAFLLVDLGLVKYPIYECKTSEKVFASRDDLLAYEEAIEVAQIMDQSLDQNNIELVMRCIVKADSHILASFVGGEIEYRTESVATFLSHFSASWVYSKVVLLGISFLEHERRYSDAVKLLKRLLNHFTSDGRRGYWTLRVSIDLEHMGRVNESLTIAEEGLLDPWVRAGSRMALQRRILRLSKPPRRWRTPSFSESIKRKITEVHVCGRPLNCEIGMRNRFYGEDDEQCGVEDLALQYYAGEGGGWKGVHTESGIWLTIFALLMWDVLFSTVPNVFHTKFQTAPLDLETDSFYTVRKSLIESQLKKISDGMADEILITSWESHQGTACRGVNWDRHSLSELRAAVTCIGRHCLASLCRHLAQDYRSWSSGMPDLLLWRFHGEYSGEAKLVEVKGPRDRLSEQQRAWLLLLMDCGFNVELCKVSPMPEST